MRILVFDTETTGLYNKKETDLSKQPHIIQFAGIVYNIETDKIDKEINIFFKPPISVPLEASNVHHIYNIDLIDKKPFSFYAEELSVLIQEVDCVVWHNIEFDETMMRIEYNRLKAEGRPVDYAPRYSICTMNSSINFCRLPKKNSESTWFKRPKLQELMKATTGKYFYWAHDALVDVKATLSAFLVLLQKWVVKIKKNNTLRLF